MKNAPKFDIKLSFTGSGLKGNQKYKQNSLLLKKLFNKKINIHLKINLDKLEQQYNNKKLDTQKSKINEINDDSNSKTDILIEEDSKESIIESKENKISKIYLDNKKANIFKKSEILLKNNARSVSNQRGKIINFKKNILVLDLDETLVYVTDTKNEYLGLPQIQFNYYIFDESEKFIKENFNKLGLRKLLKSTSFLTIRPNFKIFINLARQFYNEIVIFTSGQYSYAEEIIKIIDKQKIISKIYSRKDCSFYNDVFYKDLNKIKDDLSHTIIIDNYPESYLLQHFNGLPIPSFMGDPNDNELMKLLPLLERLSKVKDVRNYIKQIIDNHNKINFSKAYQLLDIKRENVPYIEKEDRIKKFNYIKKNNNIILKDKLYNSKSNFKIKKTFGKSILTDNNYNGRAYNSEVNNNINNANNYDDDENILVNDQNNYFYIEKNSSSTSRNKENKKNNIILLSNNNNKFENRNKKNKNINLNKVKLCKSLSNKKGYKLLKPQVINNITINNNKNLLYNDYKKLKIKKDILINNNNINSKKIINNLSENSDFNIININSNISYLNNNDDSFFRQNQNNNSIKKNGNKNLNIKSNKNNKKNIPYNIYSYNKKSKIFEKTKEKNLSSIPEISENKIIYNQERIDSKESPLIDNKNKDFSKKFIKIPINKMKQTPSFHEKKMFLSQ